MNKNPFAFGMTLAASLQLTAAPAWAVLGTQHHASDIDPSVLQQQAPSCDNTCGLVVTRNSDGAFINRGLAKVSARNGERGWNGFDGAPTSSQRLRDDQWCADHGQQTNANVSADSGNAPTLSSLNGRACSVKVSQQDVNLGLTCEDVNDNLLRCMMHNSQIESQCLARAKVVDARERQGLVAVLDTLAAGTCTSVCLGQVAGPLGILAGTVGRTACAASGATASVGELHEMAKMFATDNVVSTSNLLTVSQGGAAAGTAGVNSVTQTFRSQDTCYAAFWFALVAGLRYKSYADLKDTEDAACKAASSLFSNAVAQGGGGNGLPPGVTVPAGSGGFAGLSGSGGSQSGGTNNGTTGTGTDGESALSQQCQQMNGSNCFGAATASDLKLLNDSGLGSALLPEVAKLTKGDLRKALEGGPGSLASALGGSEIGAEVGKVASVAAAKGGPVLDPSVSAAMLASGGGANGSKGGSAESGGGLFGGLFGGGTATSQGPSPASVNFQSGAPNTDIFHAGTTQNLFQIVSDKIGKVQARVGN